MEDKIPMPGRFMSGGQMDKDYPPSENSPCRESTLTVVQHALTRRRQEVAALEQLEKMLTKGGIENGSPLEELLWEALHQCRGVLR